MTDEGKDIDLKAVRVCVDKELPPGLRLAAAELAIEESPDNAPSGSAEAQLRVGVGRGALETFGAVLTGKKWGNGRTVRVHHMNGDPALHARVEQFAKQWEAFANIAFVFGQDATADIRIRYSDDNQSWSHIGVDAGVVPQGAETMHFGWLRPETPDDEARRVVIHEFGHALGMIHEHQNPSVTINWNKPVVYRYYDRLGWSAAMVDANLFARCVSGETQFDDYDPKSIMHYAVPPEFTTDHVEVGWNRELSPGDKRFIARVYPKAVPAGAPPPADLAAGGTQWRVEWRGNLASVGGS